MCLPYRTISDIKGTIELENPDDYNDDELTKEEMKIIIKELTGLIKKFDMHFKNGSHFSFDINEWMSSRNRIVEKLKKKISD
jgi:hypothetical protein